MTTKKQSEHARVEALAEAAKQTWAAAMRADGNALEKRNNMKNSAIEIPGGQYCTRDIEREGCPWYYRNNDNDDTCGCPKIGQRLEEDDEGVLRSELCRETYPLGAVVTIAAKD